MPTKEELDKWYKISTVITQKDLDPTNLDHWGVLKLSGNVNLTGNNPHYEILHNTYIKGGKPNKYKICASFNIGGINTRFYDYFINLPEIKLAEEKENKRKRIMDILELNDWKYHITSPDSQTLNWLKLNEGKAVTLNDSEIQDAKKANVFNDPEIRLVFYHPVRLKLLFSILSNKPCPPCDDNFKININNELSGDGDNWIDVAFNGKYGITEEIAYKDFKEQILDLCSTKYDFFSNSTWHFWTHSLLELQMRIIFAILFDTFINGNTDDNDWMKVSNSFIMEGKNKIPKTGWIESVDVKMEAEIKKLKERLINGEKSKGFNKIWDIGLPKYKEIRRLYKEKVDHQDGETKNGGRKRRTKRRTKRRNKRRTRKSKKKRRKTKRRTRRKRTRKR